MLMQGVEPKFLSLQPVFQSLYQQSYRPKFLTIFKVFQKELYNCIPNVSAWRVLRKYLHLKTYKLSIVQDVERWIVFAPLSVNIFVSFATH
jgi:hypothetical protein